MLKWLKNVIKHWVAKDEIRALYRYRQAAQLAYRWNGQLPNSAETAQWIAYCGEGVIGQDISGFREVLRSGEEQRIEAFLQPSKEAGGWGDVLRHHSEMIGE